MASSDSGVISRMPLGFFLARDLTPWAMSPCQGMHWYFQGLAQVFKPPELVIDERSEGAHVNQVETLAFGCRMCP